MTSRPRGRASRSPGETKGFFIWRDDTGPVWHFRWNNDGTKDAGLVSGNRLYHNDGGMFTDVTGSGDLEADLVGAAPKVERINVTGPSGTVETATNVAADQATEITEARQ